MHGSHRSPRLVLAAATLGALVLGASLPFTASSGAAEVQGCAPAADRLIAGILLETHGATAPAGIEITLAYPERRVALPGSADAASVQARIDGTPADFLVSTNDQDDALRVAMASGTATLADGIILRVGFDRCADTTAPRVEDFACRVRKAVDEHSQPLAGITCAVRLPEPAAAHLNSKEKIP